MTFFMGLRSPFVYKSQQMHGPCERYRERDTMKKRYKLSHMGRRVMPHPAYLRARHGVHHVRARLRRRGGPAVQFRQSAGFHEAEAYFLAAQKRMGMLLCRSGVIDA